MTGPAERLVDRIVEAAVTRAVVGRGGVLRELGGSTLLGAIGALFPLTTAKVMAQEVRGALERKQLKILGKVFDPSSPEESAKSIPVARSSRAA